MKFVKIGLSVAAVLVVTSIVGLWLFLRPPCVHRTIDSQWEAVVSSGGCMMGHDDWIPSEGRGPWEGWSVDTCWMHITTGESTVVIPFLTAKLPSRRGTGVHVDPFDAAIEGELAVYALQHATRKNWYDYQGGNPSLNAALKVRQTREQQPPGKYLDFPNDQQLLQELLNDHQAREAIVRYFSADSDARQHPAAHAGSQSSMEKKFKLRAEQITALVQDDRGAYASDEIMVNGRKVGYMYRQAADFPEDSGWRFLAGSESQAYADDPNNFGIYSVNTIANYDRDIIPLLSAPVGSKFQRSTKTGKLEAAK